MANTQTAGQRARKRQGRREWLLARPDLFARLPGVNDDVTLVGRGALEHARIGLTAAGLYAPSSEPMATRWGIRRLVSDIRGEKSVNKSGRRRS